MKKMIAYVWFGFVLLLSSTLADKEESAEANQYIDKVLENLKQSKELVSKFDPLTISNIDLGNLKFSDSWIYGLSSMHRSGDCIISYDGEKIKGKVNLAVNNIRINTDYFYHVWWFINIDGVVNALIKRLDTRLEISFNQKEGKVNVDDFKITHFGDIAVTKATGVTVFLNWLLKIIFDGIANSSKGIIINAIENMLPSILETMLNEIVSPFP